MKQYKVVILGAGRIGAFFDEPKSKGVLTHAHAFYLSEKFELVGFYDKQIDSAKKAAVRWNTKYFESLEEALKEADVVCCTVPDAYHYEILKEVAKYNVKVVFGEKPITEQPWQAKEICDLYKERQIPLQINYSRRYLQEFSKLKQEISQFGKFMKGVGYYGKGILHNGSHMLDLIQMLLGRIESAESFEKIFDFFEEDPSVEVKLQVAGGTCYLHPIDCRVATIFELELFFEKARIRILNGGENIEIYTVQSSPIYEGYVNYYLQETRKVNYDGAMQRAVENIYGYLEGEEALLCPMQEAASVLELCCSLK